MIPFRFNLDFKNIDKVLNSPLIWVLICVLIGAIMGSILSSKDLTKDKICRKELDLISNQLRNIETLEADLSECVAAGEISCIDREKRLCRIEKEKIKENCDLLLNRIVTDFKND